MRKIISTILTPLFWLIKWINPKWNLPAFIGASGRYLKNGNNQKAYDTALDGLKYMIKHKMSDKAFYEYEFELYFTFLSKIILGNLINTLSSDNKIDYINTINKLSKLYGHKVKFSNDSLEIIKAINHVSKESDIEIHSSFSNKWSKIE